MPEKFLSTFIALIAATLSSEQSVANPPQEIEKGTQEKLEARFAAWSSLDWNLVFTDPCTGDWTKQCTLDDRESINRVDPEIAENTHSLRVLHTLCGLNLFLRIQGGPERRMQRHTP